MFDTNEPLQINRLLIDHKISSLDWCISARNVHHRSARKQARQRAGRKGGREGTRREGFLGAVTLCISLVTGIGEADRGQGRDAGSGEGRRGKKEEEVVADQVAGSGFGV
jgi:hypothetical protein